jgi:hypothetical protein
MQSGMMTTNRFDTVIDNQRRLMIGSVAVTFAMMLSLAASIAAMF